jgi:16S rRNA (uracil1498-N3)-methyltransferase
LKELADVLSADAITRIVLSESLGGTANAVRIGDVVQSQWSEDDVILAIGPEGGWVESELAWFHEKRWAAASLGATILRAETAAIVATALALEALRQRHQSQREQNAGCEC